MTRFIALASGKGGVGKTTITLNLGQALINAGRQAVVVDANLGTPHIALHLGVLNPQGTLNHFLRREKSLSEVTYLSESGLSFIPASPSYEEYQKTNPQLLHEIFEHLDDTAEFVLIDSPGGTGYETYQVLKHSDEVLVVVTPNLSSVLEGIKIIQMAKATNTTIGGVILNLSNRGRHELARKEVEEMIGYPVMAEIPVSAKFRKALQRQAPLQQIYPRCRAAKRFAGIAKYLLFQEAVPGNKIEL